LSGRGLCDELITRPEESYRLCCIVCDLETSRIGTPYIYIYDISSLRVKHLSHRVHNAEKSHAKYFQNIQINCWAAIPLSLPSWLTSCLFQHDKLILGDTKYHQTAFSPWHGTSWKWSADWQEQYADEHNLLPRQILGLNTHKKL